jgi:hypothetical protein
MSDKISKHDPTEPCPRCKRVPCNVVYMSWLADMGGTIPAEAMTLAQDQCNAIALAAKSSPQ